MQRIIRCLRQQHHAGEAVQLPALHRYPVQTTLPICNDAVIDARMPTA